MPAIPRWIGWPSPLMLLIVSFRLHCRRPAISRHANGPAARPASCGRAVSGLGCTRMIKSILMRKDGGPCTAGQATNPPRIGTTCSISRPDRQVMSALAT